MKILVLGGASYDDIIHVDEFFEPKAATIFAKESYSMSGSTGVGKALALKKLGFDVSLQALIGKDIYAEIVQNELKQAGVDFHPFLVNETEQHTNIMDKHGQRITIYKVSSEGSQVNVVDYEEMIHNTDLVCLNIKDYCRRFIPLIKKYKKPIYCDLHDYDLGNPYHQDFIEASDYIFLSSDRMSDYQPFMESMIQQGKQWVVVTHADKGASAMDKTGNFVEIAADNIDLVDTNGAGDNFFSGFLYGFLNDHSLKESLLLGKFTANTCIQSNKIIADYLSSDYILKKLSETDKN